MNAEYENGHYINFRSLNFVYEDGTKELVQSSDSSSYARVFTPVGGYKHIYTWKPAKTGKIKVIYNVSQFEDHGEASQVIEFTVRQNKRKDQQIKQEVK